MKLQLTVLAAFFATACAPGCAHTTGSAPAPIAAPTPALPPLAHGEVALLAVGDIARCEKPAGPAATAALVSQLEGPLLALGDASNDQGTLEQYQQCFARSWGAFKPRIHPVAGNHDYFTDGAAGFFAYWGKQAGEHGHYAFDVGSWRVIALDSNCAKNGGCGSDSEQLRWLMQELASNPRRCTLAYWHHPRFSSGKHGDDARTALFWRELHRAGAEIVLNGHDHQYERFAPLDPEGKSAPELGIRQFIAGTGGAGLRDFGIIAQGSEFRQNESNGVLRLVLRDGSYDWQFIAVDGRVLDSGTGSCH